MQSITHTRHLARAAVRQQQHELVATPFSLTSGFVETSVTMSIDSEVTTCWQNECDIGVDRCSPAQPPSPASPGKCCF